MANGTNRQILGLKRKDRSVRIGEGDFENNLITEKANQTGTARFLGGRTTLRREEIEPDLRERFRETPEFFAPEEVEKPTSRLVEERERKRIAGEIGVRPVGAGVTRARPPVEEFAEGDVARRDLTKLKRGEKIGRLTIGRETAEEEALRKFGIGRKGEPSVFSEEGIRRLFGSAAELAKVFASPEFQERKAKGIQAATAAKGRQADIKARNERIKALGDLRKSLIESGEEEGSAMLENIDKQLQGVILGRQGSDTSQRIGVLGQLLKLGPLTKEQEQLFTGA
jgi:hypothetical protein